MRPVDPPFHARALWLMAPGRAVLREEALPELGPDQLLVRTLYSGISRGTERLVFQGRVPPSEWQRMRAPHQQGEFGFPLKYGYASVGVVSGGSPDLQGARTFCLYPHQDAYVVARADVHVVPADVPSARAVLAANMETALNAVWDAELRAGDRVAVIGAGVVGCLVAYLAARHPGCQVTLVDVDLRKRSLAAALGVGWADPAEAPLDCDLVFHASGQPAGLQTALASAGREASVMELSWYGDQRVQLALGEGFHAQRLSLRSSQVGSLPAAQRTRWTHHRRLGLALSFLRDPALDALLGAGCAFANLPERLADLLQQESGEMCPLVEYPAPSEPA